MRQSNKRGQSPGVRRVVPSSVGLVLSVDYFVGNVSDVVGGVRDVEDDLDERWQGVADVADPGDARMRFAIPSRSISDTSRAATVLAQI